MFYLQGNVSKCYMCPDHELEEGEGTVRADLWGFSGSLTWPRQQEIVQGDYTSLGCFCTRERENVPTLGEVQAQYTKEGADSSKEQLQPGEIQEVLHLLFTDRAGC